MSHHPKPSNDIADILAGTLMVSRGTALDIMRDTLATTGTQCQWRQADTISMPDTWEADCGAAWTFTDGGPKDNEMNFCPRCGHSLKQIDNAMTHKNDPYASEAETQALLAPDTRTEAERKLDKMMDELGAWEQGAEPYPLLRHIALELLKKQLAEQPAQQEPVAVVEELPIGEGNPPFKFADLRDVPTGAKLYTTPPAAPVQEPVEGYPSDWAKVTLMVSPKGEMHAIAGDRETGDGDEPYIGLERIKAASPAAQPAVQEPSEALRLADAIDPFTRKFIDHLTCKVAADELRRLHAENERLRAAQPAAPLTDEQIESLLPDDDTPMSLGEAFVKFARLVEAHHGITEKGHP